ncbi:flavodoxin domain-containing protein [Patescibacteria group bacterium]|nr:flavodoxin domain-containing protein [Patescibacteria group bacterium]
MKTLIVYDSFFGNTKLLAETIGKEFGNDAKVIHVSDFENEDLKGVGLLIVGSPILGWRPSEKTTAFIMSFGKDQLKGIKVATFDTRMKIVIHGDATKKMSEMLAKLGAEVIVEPNWFIVTGKEGPLADGELERAKEWGKQINEMVV